ncbi:conserved hypothetical protein [Histoplasma capsulatum G186AR]|uniref:BSD domain-containing protein n=2 Tax=Ajellomyces capsulatus TaxID=5037 RepID=C0NTE7_AJECG|nr:uncharacterized protein HCBG_06427 [Histoplasma capsulatum G186AR]EEH05308.1 conserved hypothetical protein [Histoplasma capsulatum G186AR]KAG5305318.1 NAP family protein [Histoplasma capsulatum]QSS76279.1 NAP family protein [Histoplasma capsulatum G186AR]
MASDDEVPLLKRMEFMTDDTPVISKETTREMALLEREFVEAEVQALRASVPIFRPLYTRRNALITSKLSEAEFWPRVFSNLEEYVLPSDEIIIDQCLKNFTVERFSVNDAGDAGEPRNVRFTFEFDTSPEQNPWFGGDGKFVKDFYWRKSIGASEKSGRRSVWEGLVSQPVRIPWRKAEMDPTKGLLDAACDLAEAEEKVAGGKGKKVTPEQRLELPEYEKVVKEVAKAEAMAGLHAEDEEDEDEDGDDDDDNDDEDQPTMSFFAWFGYRGRDISAEESEEAVKADEEYWGKISRGEKVDGDEGKDGEDADDVSEEGDDDDGGDEDGLMDAEIFPDGHELAMALSEDIWENAFKYYVQSLQMGDGIDSGFDFDMDGMEDDEDDDDDDDDDEEEADRPRKKVKT